MNTVRTLLKPRTVPRFTPRSFQNGSLPDLCWRAWDDTTGAFSSRLPRTFSLADAEEQCRELNDGLCGNIGDPHWVRIDA